MALHADGHEFPIELAVSVMAGETPALYTAFLRDITDRKRFERDLAAARDDALHAAEMKSEFLATMSHEIRTPMYGVIGTLDLLRQTALDHDQNDLVDIMVDSSQGLLEIINGVLDFSKLEAGQVQVAVESFSLRAIAEGVMDLLGPEARRKRLRLLACVDPGVPGLVRGDPGRVRQMLVNLVGNAVKFTDQGDVAVRISLDGQDQNGPVVRIDVVDTGIGIPLDAQAEIFQPFIQVDAGRSRVHAGTGLGLAITQRLVQVMNGTITCTSRPGAGTTVSLRIPFAPVPGELEAPADFPLRGRRIGLDLRPGISVNALAVTLGGLGAEVVPLRGAPAGSAPNYDLVVTDHESARGPEPALVITTGTDTVAAADGELSIAWPIRADRLSAAVLTLVGMGHDHGALDERPPTSGPTPVSPQSDPREDLPRVLLVDDNDVNRSLARRQLELLSVSCRAVASGPEALHALQEDGYALVLMDCRMPGMDGFETTRRIREHESRSGDHTPIVAVTADGRPEDRRACLAAGMDDHIAKPMTIADLDRVLTRWVADGGPGPAHVAEIEDNVDDDPPPGIPTLIAQIGHEETARLVETWKRETPRRLAAMREALDRNDLAEVASAAHVLKSTCGLFGADDAAETAAGAEHAAREGDFGDLPALYRRLEDQVTGAMTEFDSALAVK
jgi:two-component system sensor histidine kinase/response regulator